MKCRTKEYTSAVKLTEDAWKCTNRKQKLDLLKSMNLDKSWAETRTIKEMVNRGGGLTAKSLLSLNRLYLARKGGRVTVKWT